MDARDVKLFPIDGGNCEVDEKTSFPLTKQKYSLLWAATINLNANLLFSTTFFPNSHQEETLILVLTFIPTFGFCILNVCSSSFSF